MICGTKTDKKLQPPKINTNKTEFRRKIRYEGWKKFPW